MRFLILSLCLFFEISFADSLLGLPPLMIPADNLQTPEKIQLGQRLFHDKRLSADGSVSCASCHQAEKGFADGLKTAVGINGQVGFINAPTVMNAAFYQDFFVDGRSASLEEQALAPFVNPIEHGLKNSKAIVELVQQDENYLREFKHVFNLNPT